MKRENIEKAHVIAQEFITRADALIKCMNTPDKWGKTHGADWYLKERTALRRQSMELTRALADLRRP